jgi:ATP synthase F1 delta subunit
MNKTQIAKRYSRTLISTFDISAIPGILEGLQIFSKLIDANKKLRLLFISGIFLEDEKDRALKTLLSYLKVSKQTERFLKLIIMQGHLSAIKEIIKASIAAYNEKLKRETAMVISPLTLEKKHIERLKNALRAITQKEINIESQVDPSLLGGFIVKVGSTVYDSSLKGQLQLLRTELTR